MLTHCLLQIRIHTKLDHMFKVPRVDSPSLCKMTHFVYFDDVMKFISEVFLIAGNNGKRDVCALTPFSLIESVADFFLGGGGCLIKWRLP